MSVRPFADSKKTVFIWQFRHAPKEYQELSPHGGDEDWVAFEPAGYGDLQTWADRPWVQDSDTWFGCCEISHHEVEGGTVHIGAHA